MVGVLLVTHTGCDSDPYPDLLRRNERTESLPDSYYQPAG